MPTTTTNRSYPKPLGSEPANGPGGIGALADAVDADVQALAVPTAWVAPTLGNSWVVAFSNTVGYRKVGDVVQLRGMIQSGTLNTTIFTLPSGFRPVQEADFAQSSNGAGIANVKIINSGVVQVSYYLSGSNGWVALDGIQFATV